jgi:hypothetical protein
MKNTDKLYKVLEIKNQFEKLQKKYQTQLPKIDPYLVYDLLIRQQKNPGTIYMYNIEVRTKRRQDTNAPKEYVYKKTEMLPAVYDKGTHYVTNQKLTLEMLKEISDCDDVVQVSGEYTSCSSAKDISYEFSNHRNPFKHSFYG